MAVRMSGLVSGLDTESIVTELMNAEKQKKVKIENKKTKLEWKQDQWSELNKKIYGLYTDTLSKLRLQGNYNKKATTSSDENIVTATAAGTASNGTNKIEVSQLASSQYVTGKKMTGLTSSSKLVGDCSFENGTEVTFTSGTGADKKTIKLTVDATTTIGDFIDSAEDAGLRASYDTAQGRFFINSKNSGADNIFTISTNKDGASTPLSNLGLGVIDGSEVAGVAGSMTVVAAKDSVMKLNGAELTGSSNVITANGVTYTLNKTTGVGETVNIGVTTDNDAIYDMVKGFVDNYNTVLASMNTGYYAASSNGYEVLTDDQKEQMTEDQIDKWETKIKDSLLRRDSTLGSLITSFKSSVMGTTTVDGQKYSLASLGIQTSTDYTEKGLLHIYGEETDTAYSAKTSKLKEMIEEDPDKVAKIMSGLVTNLYSTLQDKMRSSTLNSALTFYNDKQIKSQLKEYETDITEWDDRLNDMENRYYKQFSAMETAMSKLNSQSSYLTNLMG